ADGRPAAKLGLEPGPQAGALAVVASELRREPVPAERAGPFLDDEAGLAQQGEAPGHAGLRQSKNRGQLGHVERVPREHSEQPQPRRVPEEPEEGGWIGCHITKSTYID